MLRKRLTLAVVGLCAVWLNASSFTVDGLNYETHKGAPYTTLNTVALTGATSRSIESLTVPATVTYNGVEYYVDYIHPDAFDNYSNLRSVRFEDSPHIIQSIGRLKEPIWLWPTSPFQNCPIEEYYIGRDIIYKSNEMDQLVLESTAESVSITFAGEITYLSSLPFYYMHTNTTSQILPRLTSLSIGGTISEIKSGTFADAINLKNLTILPGNAFDLRTEMFAEGQVFENVTLEGSQYGWHSQIAYSSMTLGATYRTIPEDLFNSNPYITNVIISEGITKIGDAAFKGCYNLTSITFPSTLEEIGSYAFDGCKQLQNVTFNDGLKKIGMQSFGGCIGLDRLVIPGSVEEISSKAFLGATNVNEILIEPAADGSVLKMGDEAISVREFETLTLNRVITHSSTEGSTKHLSDCNPKHIVFGEGWETIPQNFMMESASLTSVTLSPTVRVISESAFNTCYNLIDINFPTSLEEIGSYAFNGCKQLQNVTFNDGLKKIGMQSFVGCIGLDRLVIPGSAEEISSKAFSAAWNVNEILIEPATDGSVLKMGDEAISVREFETLTLNRVITHSSTEGSTKHLSDCNPKHIVFGEGWETIPQNLLTYRPSITSITLPASLTRIDSNAFSGCSQLKELTVLAVQPPECGAENVFASQIFPVAALYVPNGSRDLYEEAFVWRNFSNIAVIGNPVISVNYNAEGGTVALNGTAIDTIEVEPGDRVELTVIPAEGYELVSFTINGENVIDLLVDGMLVIDSVEDSMRIEVEFGLSSGVGELTGETSVLSMRPGVISLSGMAEGDAWQIYDIAGTLIYSGNDAEVAVAPGLYVVRIGGGSHRVMVR